MSEDKQKAVRDTINNYLARGWIRPNTGSYGASVIVIWKKNGQLHIIINYWLLNTQTRLDSYPIPCIDKLLDCLAHAKYFKKIDLASGYHQIKMADDHEDKTAYFSGYSIYKWMISPLGLTNAPATFQSLMKGILYDLLNKMQLVNLDDLLLYSDMDIQYLEDIKYILQRLYDNKLKAKKEEM